MNRFKAGPNPTAETIQTWLIDQVAQHLQIDPAEINPSEPFARYGLDSMHAVTLSGDLEEWLDVRLPATLAWDYPTIELLAAHLAEVAGARRPAGA